MSDTPAVPSLIANLAPDPRSAIKQAIQALAASRNATATIVDSEIRQDPDGHFSVPIYTRPRIAMMALASLEIDLHVYRGLDVTFLQRMSPAMVLESGPSARLVPPTSLVV